MSADPKLNPTLSIEAHFLAPLGEDSRSSRFVLRQAPEIATWLLSFIDHILARQGKLAGQHPIAEPPAGAVRERLIAGAVILAGTRPDGGLALRLNPGLEVRLWLNVRRAGKAAQVVALQLAAEPALSRWLLGRFAAPDGPGDTWPRELDARLRQLDIVVERLPPADVHFPDPSRPAAPATELATAARIFYQEPHAAVPADVARLLGRRRPALPPGRPLAWGVDAGTGLVFPALAADSGPGLPPDFTGTGAGRRALLWDRQRSEARAALRSRRYATLREILPPVQRELLRRHVRELVTRGYFPPVGDGQVEQRSAIHNEPTIASLHEGLAGIVADITGETVLASYCYLGCYEEGAVLHRHRDRPQCNYNLSLVLDMQGPSGEPGPWPIWLEIDGQPVAVNLGVGDGLVYSGTELWHWRDALPAGQRAIVCFFHFVPGNFTGSLD